MKARSTFLIAAVVGAFALGGCAHRPPSNAQVGTGVGAVAGGLLGNAMFGSTLGTVGGAAAGALIGNQVGQNSDYNDGRRRRR
ncbi:glycine zipper domain-containing protein [Comamonas aquatica]|uniref:glycine zipper domain-containing protein n=1 Tax=Comamonas aquatica TaxID=225991 RepID=UPI0028D7F4A7|nr:glycine zipper 2TM domain-containing protein [Comamonas aquatica]